MELMKENYHDLPIMTDEEIIPEYLCTDNEAIWVELGCGAAKTTLALAEKFPNVQIRAYEVDTIQHDKNVASNHPDNVGFGLGGMQDFPVEKEGSVDAVIMLKSIHHVPHELLEEGFAQVYRALKPGGKLYVSEPIFAGELNDVLKLFHNEEGVRAHAFEAMKHQVEQGNFSFEKEIHFLSRVSFPMGFADFEEKIIHSTHIQHQLSAHSDCDHHSHHVHATQSHCQHSAHSHGHAGHHASDEIMKQVRERFQEHVKEDGSADFLMPMRVDVLVKMDSSKLP